MEKPITNIIRKGERSRTIQRCLPSPLLFNILQKVPENGIFKKDIKRIDWKGISKAVFICRWHDWKS